MTPPNTSPSRFRHLDRLAIVALVVAVAVVLGVMLWRAPTSPTDSSGPVTPVAPVTFSPVAPHSPELGPSVNPGTPAASMTRLEFSDEFNATSLDTTKWSSGRYSTTTQADGAFNPPKEEAYYASSQVNEANGNVYLTVARSRKVIDGKTYTYVSGLIQSNHNYWLTSGSYVEARVRVNTCKGCWPAFWTKPSEHWPPELDIFEYFLPSNLPRFNSHLVAGGPAPQDAYGEPGSSYVDAYHTYGMYWDGRHVTPYLDGIPYKTRSADDGFPEYLIFNLAVLAHYSPQSGTNMAIDWIRVWR